ncbi:uncharacterized protein [Choristoneura fumiferana]|uniref:uncharacterized protein n=1 Tax=Choristoneura fumiferana TaxID=7141 RepID=UPI003D157300
MTTIFLGEVSFTTEACGQSVALAADVQVLRGVGRAELVDSKLSSVNSPTSPTTNSIPGDRCIGPGLGGSAEQSSTLRVLDIRRTEPTLQSKRDAGHITCSPASCTLITSQLDPHTVRQQDRRSQSAERRRCEIISPNRNNVSNSEFARSPSNPLQHTLSPRQIQQSSGSLVTPSPTPGVAPATCLRRNSICEVGNSTDRPFCLKDSSCRVQLRDSRPDRSSSLILRRVQHSMELPARMDIPTTVPSSQGSHSPESVLGNILNSGTTMGESVLARGPQSSSTSSTPDPEKFTKPPNRHVDRPSTSGSRENYPRSLEMWGWSEAITTWSTEQVTLLKNSWRKSTVKTYEVAWKRWVNWSNTNNIDTKNPTGAQLAQFLSDLHIVNKLSYSTILLHKSVVSTLCNTETSSKLSSHVLVKHILKSIALENPKTIKPPVWDVSKLIEYMSNYTIDTNNVFEISRHTATLLLLCSGRRVHDLTLLTIDPSHCIKSSNSIIFWPQFGSKTDSSSYRQSGWKLLENDNNRNLNPLFWIEKTITLLNERRIDSKSFNLFITIKGEARPASRTVIAGWVKTLFKNAGITAAPGSIRSAVASKSWLENHPIDEILSRGNWQSAHTFQQFYRREIITSVDSENVTHLFDPIN